MAFRPAGFSDSESSGDDGGWDSGDFGGGRNRARSGWGGGHGGAGRGLGNSVLGSANNNNVDDVVFEDAAKQKLLERAKKYIRSCLISTKGFTEINDLDKEYQDVCEARIPFRQLGFSSLEEFLTSIPSVCRVRNMGFSVMVEGLADSKTMHIKEMKMREKNTGGGKKKKRKGGGGGFGGYYSGGRSGSSRRGFSYGGHDDFDDGGFSIGGGGGSYGASSSRNNPTSSTSIQPSRPASASTSSRNASLYRALEKKDNVSNKANTSNKQLVHPNNLSTSNCETDVELKQTTDMASVSDRLKEILGGRAFGLLLPQASKMYEKKWQERLPDIELLMKMAGFCIEGKGTAPTIIKLIEDKPAVAAEKSLKVQDKEAAITITTGADRKDIGDGFSNDDLLVVEEVKKLLEKRVFGLPKTRVEVLIKKQCPVNFNSDIFDQMEIKNLVKIEGQHNVVKWIAAV